MSGGAGHPPGAGADTAPEAPAFDAPWQAQLFALTVHLSERGAFSWPDWAEAFGAEIAHRRQAAGAQDGGADYWAAWLTTLEALLEARGLADAQVLAGLRAAWEEAYLSTPHGAPVQLAPGALARARG